jgi:hypothetical protein
MSTEARQNRAGWPAHQRAALCVVTLIDGPSAEPSSRLQIGLGYGPIGFDRLLSIYADLDITSTVGVSAAAVHHAPTVIRTAVDAGLEVVPWAIGPGDFTRARHSLDLVTDEPSRGQVLGLPAHPWVGAATGASWTITGGGGDVPEAAAEGWLIPTSPFWVDQTWLDPERPLPPSSLLEAWSLGLAAVRTEGCLMTVVLNAHISGRPGISNQIVRFLDEAIESGDVWIATAGQIATWWTEQTA